MTASQTKRVIETPECRYCHEGGYLAVPEDGYQRWLRGAPTQNAFPGLSTDEREQIISGYHPECWSAYFGDLGDF
jgi:hypothetical protein